MTSADIQGLCKACNHELHEYCDDAECTCKNEECAAARAAAAETRGHNATLACTFVAGPTIVGRYSSTPDNPEPGRIMLLHSSRRYGKSLIAAAYAAVWCGWQTYHFMRQNFPTLAGYNTNVKEYCDH